MKVITLAILFVLTVCIADAKDTDTNGMTQIAKFVIGAPVNGTYFPWRGAQNDRWYAGEIITITNSLFKYTRFSDVLSEQEPNYSGPLILYNDHIYLNHPGVPYPYRIGGIADGRSVLLTQYGYEQWKKTGKVFELKILYLQKKAKSKTAVK